jgi:hypothetical protein
VLEINMLHAVKGKIRIDLLDIRGQQMKSIQMNYTGMGTSVKLDLGGLPASQYMIKIIQTDFITNGLMKQGVFQILKPK